MSIDFIPLEFYSLFFFYALLFTVAINFFKLQNADLIASLDFEFVRKKVLETYNKL